MTTRDPENRHDLHHHHTAPDRSLAALMRSAHGPHDAPVAPRPVETWHPPYCGDIGLKIRRNGVWIHQGSPIARPAIVKVFASILRKDEDGKTYLVTPAEKVDVAVEDAPFLAVDMTVSGEGSAQVLSFLTNVDETVEAGPLHPLRFEPEASSGGLKPYILVRGRLEALLTRAVYADLMNLIAPHPDRDAEYGVWSGGAWWPLPLHANAFL